MKREQRISNKRFGIVSHLNESARVLDAIINEIGVPANQRKPFMKWALNSMWKTYQTERMNQKLIIDNEIKNLSIRFANGTVKKDYCTMFKLPLEKISNPELLGIEELGLDFAVGEDGSCTLSGKPNIAGDFTLKLRYNTIEGEEPSELSIPIAFNPNPRDLWKNIPTDRHIQYYKPDSQVAYIKVEADANNCPKKDIVAASQRGRSHAQEGKPRDDHFTLYHCPDSDWYIMAVADGAGSAKYSRKGSEIACDTAVDYCIEKLLHNPNLESAIAEYEANTENATKRQELTNQVAKIVYSGAIKAHEAIKRIADANEDFKLKDFATTLMLAICKKYEFGWFIASFWVGDGAMCLYNENNGTAKLLGTPDEGEFSGQTRFLTMPEIFHDPDVYEKRLRMSIVPDFTALFLMTDGVSDPMFETDKNLNDYNKWKEFYELIKNGFPKDDINGVDLSDDNEASKEQLLEWLNFWSPGNHDDRTIAILY